MNLELPNFKSCNIVVVGDVMLDQYWHGQTNRISPEAPVPVLHLSESDTKPGGAGNVAINVATLGCQTLLLGLIGDDEHGKALNRALKQHNVDTDLIAIKGHPTTTKTRILSQHQQLIRLDKEQSFNHEHAEKLIARFSNAVKTSDAVIISDYAKGIQSVIPELITIAKKAEKPVFVDPKHANFSLYAGATMLTPNLKEFEAAIQKPANSESLVNDALNLIATHQLDALLVTQGDKGMTLVQNGINPLHLTAKAQEIFDVTGAGDTVISILAACCAAKSDLSQAVQMANYGASITVSRLGAVAVTPEELAQAAHFQNSNEKITKKAQLKSKVKTAQQQGERIVFTNGCFDIIHAGHIQYLRQAKSLGDRLIVAVNSDASVKRLKGDSRPIHALEARMAVLAELNCIDWVVPFSEDTPKELIETLMPDVLVKGGDYTIEEVVGAKTVLANGGKVELLTFLPGYSTSTIVNKLEEEV